MNINLLNNVNSLGVAAVNSLDAAAVNSLGVANLNALKNVDVSSGQSFFVDVYFQMNLQFSVFGFFVFLRIFSFSEFVLLRRLCIEHKLMKARCPNPDIIKNVYIELFEKKNAPVFSYNLQILYKYICEQYTA